MANAFTPFGLETPEQAAERVARLREAEGLAMARGMFGGDTAQMIGTGAFMAGRDLARATGALEESP